MSATPRERWQEDIGPFDTSLQAVVQFAAQMQDMPVATVCLHGVLLVLEEAATTSGLELSDHEKTVLGSALSGETAVIVAGLIIRAHLSGQDIVLAGKGESR